MSTSAPVAPVLLGADIGTYSVARAFHEAFGVRSTVVAGDALGPIAHSRILDVELVEDGRDASVIASTLVELATAREGGPRPLLIANSDWHVSAVLEHRAQLEQHFVLPLAPDRAYETLLDKSAFARLCAEAGVRTPATVEMDCHPEAADPDLSALRTPLIVKPASTAQWDAVKFPGQHKLYRVADAGEAIALRDRLRAAGFGGTVLVQELLGGDDTQNRCVTLYVDGAGEVTFACAAQVLLEEHTPTAHGNSAALMPYDDPALVAAATSVMSRLDYRGFVVFDIRLDAATGEPVFLEANPRMGRNVLHLLAAGANPATFLAADWLEVDPNSAGASADKTGLYATVPLRLLWRYLEGPLRSRAKAAARHQVVRPLTYRGDRAPRRLAYAAMALTNQWRKFSRHYPVERQRDLARGGAGAA